MTYISVENVFLYLGRFTKNFSGYLRKIVKGEFLLNRNSQNVLQRRAEENMLSSMPQAATDALYEARQQRRKQLLKEQMAKKLWEDNYEGNLNFTCLTSEIQEVPCVLDRK